MATPFHRLARETPAYGWWKLPLAGLLAVVVYFTAAVGLLITVMVGLYAVGRDGDALTDEWLDAAEQLEMQVPGFFALTMISIALMLPAVLLAVLIIGPRPVGYLTSVEGRMRWRWLARTSVMAFVVYGVAMSAVLGLSAMSDPGTIRSPQVDASVIVLVLLVLALTPFQAAAEEYVFRGYLLQLVGSWTRFAVIPVVVSVPIFVSGHEYNSWGLVDVGIFGLLAAYLTIRTGGLEAAIAAHVANNVSIMVVESLGMIESSDGGGPLDLIPTVVTSVLMAWLVARASNRQQIARGRPPIAVPPPPAWPQPYPQPSWPPVYAPPPAWPPPPAAPVLPANAPPYPGELPEGWNR